VIRSGGGGHVTIEFALPADRLHTPVDQVGVRSAPDLETPLGVMFPVVVRFLERWREPVPRARWERVAHTGGRDGEPYRIRIAADCAWGRLSIGLLRAQPAAVVIAASPGELSAEDWKNVLSALYASATPVALWARGGGSEAAAAVRGLAKAPVRDWPAAVHRLRQEAAYSGDSDHPGRHLVLLWDDPAHVVDAPVFEEPR
jgi:hypothetical protein